MSIWLNLQAVKLQYESFRSQETRKAILVALEEVRDREMNTTEFLLDRKENGGTVSENGFVTHMLPQITQIISNVTAPAMIAPARQDKLVMAIAILWLIVITIISYGSALTDSTNKLIVGVTVNLNLVAFYASPLFVIWTVLKNRNSSSIHRPTMVADLSNATFWALYGLGILDPIIIVPNGIGVGFGVVQIALCLVFPRTKVGDSEAPASSDGELKVIEVAPTTVELAPITK